MLSLRSKNPLISIKYHSAKQFAEWYCPADIYAKRSWYSHIFSFLQLTSLPDAMLLSFMEPAYLSALKFAKRSIPSVDTLVKNVAVKIAVYAPLNKQLPNSIVAILGW